MQEKIIKVYVCTSCGHKWANRKNSEPHRCPKCFKYLYIQEVNNNGCK